MIDTRRTRRVPGRGFRGDSRAAGWRPGGLRLGRTRGTWRNRRHPGKTHSALGYTAHSGFREVFGSLGTRGGSEGSRRKGFRSALGNTWRVPRVDPEGISGRLRKACGVAFGLTFGTRGMFRRKDRRVCFEGVSKKAFGETTFGMASGTGGTFRRTVRQGFRRKLRKEAIGSSFERLRKRGGVFRGHASSSEGAPKRFIGRLSKGGLRKVPRRAAQVVGS